MKYSNVYCLKSVIAIALKKIDRNILGAYLKQDIPLEFRYRLVYSKKICSKTPPLNWHSYEDK